MRDLLLPVLLAGAFAGCAAAGRHDAAVPAAASSVVAPATAADRVFEIRTYTAPDGRLPALEERFRRHTLALFERHGMTNVGYWRPMDAPRSENTVIYVLAHASREAARESWAAFGRDPEWRRVREASEADGPIVQSVESVFVRPTDYSPLR